MTASWITPEEARVALAEGDGAGVRVAVLDSGVDADHPALSGLSLTDSLSVEEGEDGPVILESPGDSFGHGTAVAWLIHQGAPAAEIGSFRILHAGSGGVAGKAAILEAAVRAAIDLDYHIINCSFGAPANSIWFRSFKNWIDAAWLADVHVVTACNNLNAARPEWPAHFPTVFPVTMTARESGLWHRAGEMVPWYAPGVNLQVPWLDRSWKTVTGSSYAAPCLTAAVARVRGRHPRTGAALMQAVLRRVAEPWRPEISGC